MTTSLAAVGIFNEITACDMQKLNLFEQAHSSTNDFICSAKDPAVISLARQLFDRVGNKVSMIYIMDIYHDFIMIFCGENIMIYIDENIRTILL
jgi:hypothetical protein